MKKLCCYAACCISCITAMLYFFMSLYPLFGFFSDAAKVMVSVNVAASSPTITEIFKPKTFFITQASGINLQDYASAFDDVDGIITDKIEISSSPEFNNAKAGTYKISYKVKNSADVSAIPLDIELITWDFVKIVSGTGHVLALTSHGQVYAWGNNGSGQIGNGTVTTVSTPILIDGLSNIVDIAAATYTSYALDASGQAYSWGRNIYGQLGIGDQGVSSLNRPAKVAQPEGVRFIQISSVSETAGAVTDQGEVYTWGLGERGVLGNGTESNSYAPININLTNIVQVSVGQICGAALTKDGMLYTWGVNNYGQLGNGASMTTVITLPAQIPYFKNADIKIKSISAGYVHMAAVSEDGRLFTWGGGGEGRLGTGTTANKNLPQEIMSKVTQAFAGYADSGIITEDGSVYFFGYNPDGKHGSGDTTDHLVPTRLNNIEDATWVCISTRSAFVLCAGKIVYCMGSGGGMLPGGNSMFPQEWAFVPPNPY